MQGSIFSTVPRSTLPTQPRVLTAPRVPEVLGGQLDARLIAILDAPLQLGESAFTGFARKEGELRAVLAEASVAASRELLARLSMPTPDDVLAARFQRLTAERRARLVGFLSTARRRAAIAAGR